MRECEREREREQVSMHALSPHEGLQAGEDGENNLVGDSAAL